jgi:hypothetical protein
MNDLFNTCCSIIELLNKGEEYNNGNEVSEIKKLIPIKEKNRFDINN